MLDNVAFLDELSHQREKAEEQAVCSLLLRLFHDLRQDAYLR